MAILDENDQPVADGERGEICIRGHNIMKGYLRRPEATEEALKHGWFHSGDVGVRDADGSYAIVDRKKDMIIRSGFNVYPSEVKNKGAPSRTRRCSSARRRARYRAGSTAG